MSADRKKKLKKIREKEARQKARKVEAEEDRRAIVGRVLRLLGVDAVFDKLPRAFRDTFVEKMMPEIEVVVADGSRDDPQVREAEKIIKSLIRKPCKDVILGHEFELAFEDIYRSYFSVVNGVDFFTDKFRQDEEPSLRPFRRLMEQAKSIIDRCDGQWLRAVLGRVCSQIIEVADNTFRLDEKALEVRIGQKVGDGAACRDVLELSAHQPVPHVVTYRGSEGIAYPCKISRWPRGLCPCTWNCKSLAIKGPDRDLPVYVSKHAIARLHERLPLVEHKPWLHRMMARSLANPVVVPQAEDKNLVELRLGTHRVGYFVAYTLPHMVLIKTFLFLTMQGTPEAERLRSKLGLYRADVEHYKLDQFYTLAASDIARDELLCKILNECGCGHLVSLLDPEDRLKWVDRFGGKMRATFDIREAREGFKVGTKFMRWGAPPPAAR